MAYKKFFFQQHTMSGTDYVPAGAVVETYEKWACVCKELPAQFVSAPKSLASRDWYDEDGEDVYVPTANRLRQQAYDIDITFLFKGLKTDPLTDGRDGGLIKSRVKGFVDYVTGKKDASGNALTSGVMLAFYDEYTLMGKRCCYVSEVSPDLYVYDDSSDEAIVQLKIKLRVTDPVTDVTFGSSSSS